MRPGDGHVACTLTLDDVRDLAQAVATVRRLLDLDADPVAIDDDLGGRSGARPAGRGPARPARAGRRRTARAGRPRGARASRSRWSAPARSPAGWSSATARRSSSPTVRSRTASRAPPSSPTWRTTTLAMPARRRDTFRTVMRLIADGDLDLSPGADRTVARRDLMAVAGIGPWTAEYVAMRALGDPDAWPVTDLGVQPRARGARRRPLCRGALAPVAVLRNLPPLEHPMTHYAHLESPVGQLLLTATDDTLTGLYLPREERAPDPAWQEGGRVPGRGAAPAAARTSPGSGRRSTCRSTPPAPPGSAGSGPSWRGSRTARRSPTRELARRAEHPSAIRAAGAANGRNPISIVIPCHRVIGADGRLTGYSGGLDAKRWLLTHEGIAA